MPEYGRILFPFPQYVSDSHVHNGGGGWWEVACPGERWRSGVAQEMYFKKAACILEVSHNVWKREEWGRVETGMTPWTACWIIKVENSLLLSWIYLSDQSQSAMVPLTWLSLPTESSSPFPLQSWGGPSESCIQHTHVWGGNSPSQHIFIEDYLCVRYFGSH